MNQLTWTEHPLLVLGPPALDMTSVQPCTLHADSVSKGGAAGHEGQRRLSFILKVEKAAKGLQGCLGRALFQDFFSFLF